MLELLLAQIETERTTVDNLSWLSEVVTSSGLPKASYYIGTMQQAIKLRLHYQHNAGCACKQPDSHWTLGGQAQGIPSKGQQAILGDWERQWGPCVHLLVRAVERGTRHIRVLSLLFALF